MLRKKLVLPVVAVAVVALAGAGWYLLSPLFLNQEVNEGFPPAAGAGGAAAARPSLTQPLAKGTFVDGDSFHKGEGDAFLYGMADGSHLLRLENFKVTNGPDLHVYLTGHAAPKERRDLDQAGYLDLGKIKGNMGDQNYVLPKDADPATFATVVIYCQPFHVVFSTATLAKP